MERTVLAAGILLIATGAAHAGHDDPRALVEAVYQPYTHHQRVSDPSAFMSDSLKALFAHFQQVEETNGVGGAAQQGEAASGFDPFVNAQHYLIYDLSIGDAVVQGKHAMVPVSYRNFDHPTELAISLSEDGGGWHIDDVASLGADQHWLLSWLLAYDPVGVH